MCASGENQIPFVLSLKFMAQNFVFFSSASFLFNSDFRYLSRVYGESGVNLMRRSAMSCHTSQAVVVMGAGIQGLWCAILRSRHMPVRPVCQLPNLTGSLLYASCSTLVLLCGLSGVMHSLSCPTNHLTAPVTS